MLVMPDVQYLTKTLANGAFVITLLGSTGPRYINEKQRPVGRPN